MSTKPVSKKSSELSNSSISSLLGVVQVLPGESEEVYQSGLIATIAELGAVTPLQFTSQKKSSSACGGCVAMKNKNEQP